MEVTDEMVERAAITLAALGPDDVGDNPSWWLRLMPERREAYMRVARRTIVAALGNAVSKEAR